MSKYIFFDIDDTLVETAASSYKIFNVISRSFGFSIEKDEFMLWYRHGDFRANITHFFSKYGNFKQISGIYEELKSTYTKKIIVAPTFLKLLENRGYKIGILTNGPAQKTLQKIAYLGWEVDSLLMILHSENMDYEKPDPRVFDYVFNKIGREYDDLIYVGDSIEDYEASKGAGVRFYGVLTGYTAKEEFISHGLDSSRILNNINDLIGHI